MSKSPVHIFQPVLLVPPLLLANSVAGTIPEFQLFVTLLVSHKITNLFVELEVIGKCTIYV